MICPKVKLEYCRSVDRVVGAAYCKTICKNGKNAKGAVVSQTPRPFPPIKKQIVSFANEAVKYVMAGRPKRTDAEVAVVKELCMVCDQYTERTGTPRCLKCGCALTIKNRWLTADCPLGKWPKIGDTNGLY